MEGLRGREEEGVMTLRFAGRVGLIQRVKPNYRVPFFDELAGRCENGFSLATGHPLTIESIPDDLPLKVGEVFNTNNIHFKDPSNRLYACYQKGLLGWLERTDPDVLFIEANFRYISSYAAIRWMKKKGRPVVGWGLGAKPMYGALGRARDNFLRGFDGVIAYSTLGAEEYKRIGVQGDKCYVAKNAVLPAPTEPYMEKALNAPIRILFVGRLQRRKNVNKLIEALAGLEESGRLMLTIVGDGPEMVGLRSLADKLLPGTRFTGHLEGQALEQAFKEADLFVLPGTGGLAVQQAMSYGLPVIVEEGDGTQRDLVTAANGWLLKESTVDELQKAISLAIADEQRLKAFGKRSYDIAVNEVNIEKMADVFVNIAKEVSA